MKSSLPRRESCGTSIRLPSTAVPMAQHCFLARRTPTAEEPASVAHRSGCARHTPPRRAPPPRSPCPPLWLRRTRTRQRTAVALSPSVPDAPTLRLNCGTGPTLPVGTRSAYPQASASTASMSRVISGIVSVALRSIRNGISHKLYRCINPDTGLNPCWKQDPLLGNSVPRPVGFASRSAFPAR